MLVLLLFLGSGRVLSIDVKRLSIEDGLSNSIVFSISQNSKGLIWVGTRSGINSYDGSQFNHYDLKTASSSLPAQGRHILYDANDNLWVGTTNGIFKYVEEKDIFEIASSKFLNFQNFKVFKIEADSKNQLWIGSSNSLFVFNPELDSLRQIKEINITVKDILCVNHHYTIVATIRGVYKINNSDFSVTPISVIKSINDTFSNKFVSSLNVDDKGQIWIAVSNKGLFIYDPDNETLNQVGSIQNYIGSGISISDIELVDDSTYLIATDGNGLLILDRDYAVKEHLIHIEDDDFSLSANGIRDIFVDSEKRIWISTHGGGICLFDPFLLPFNRIEHITNDLNSIANNNGKVVIEDQHNRLWFGTNKGISIYFPDEKKWEHISNTTNRPEVLGQNNVNSICQVDPDKIWVGSYGGGIDEVNINTFEVKPVFPKDKVESLIGSSFVYDIYKCSEGFIWIGLLRSQMVRYNPETREIVRYPIIDILQIEENESDKIVASSKQGLYILNKTSGEIRQYYHKPEDPLSISSSEINATHIADDGKIYIGTESGGLNIFDPENEEFIHFTIDHGLPSNSVYGIVNDHQGMIWLSTSNGISKFNPADKSFENYSVSDGLHISEFMRTSSIITENGMILFGGTKGFVSFYPDQINKISIPPKLIFTDLKISNLSVCVDPEKGPLKRAIDLTDKLTFGYRQNSFSLSFTGINYTNSIKNQYSWKLEGFEDDWSPRTKDNTATYTNIPPGNYTFKVRSTNLQDVWNGNERSITMEIKPTFFKTHLAYTIYFAILVTIVLMIFKFQRIRYEEQHAKEKIQFFVNLAHDLRTPLTLIQSPLSKILENNSLSKADEQYLSLSKRNADKLGQIFNQLLDFQKSDIRKMQLQVDEYDMVEYLRNVIFAFKPLLDKKLIDCNLTADREKLMVWFDMQKMDKVLYNLLSNATKYTQEGGEINVTAKADNKQCFIEIKDNGIGIPREQQKNVFKNYFRATNAINTAESGSGVGLILVKQLIEIHKGLISFESRPNEGTSLTIRIPMGKRHFQPSDFLDSAEKTRMTVSKTGKIYVPEILSEPVMNANGKGVEKSKKTKVVVAEDNNELRDFLIDSLKPYYRIFGAPNGKEALSVVEKIHPDIIITDVMMPEMDGTTLCVHLKRHIETCHIPIILLTALTDSEYKIGGYEMGADAYLEKPFDIKVLQSRIENLLKSRERLKDKFLRYSDLPEKIDFQSKIDQEFIQKAVQIVNDNLCECEFSVDKFCKLLYVSRSVLYRKLTALLDQTPQDFIKTLRLKKAVEYIRQTDMNVTEIAYQTGFSDPKYFTTCFKKQYGVSPSRYKG